VARKFEAEGLIRWAKSVFREAGVAPSDDEVREMAAVAASNIITVQFLPFADEHGVDQYLQYFHDTVHHTDAFHRLEAFDEQRDQLVAMTAAVEMRRAGDDWSMHTPHSNRAVDAVDALITEFKDGVHPTWVQDIREQHGITGDAIQPAPGTAAASTGGCLVATSGLLAVAAIIATAI
jgi:hypothetical protein